MLIDEVQIIVKAGNGGNGASSFKRNAQTAKGGPDGGNGGNGGNVYFQGINDITALSEFTYKKKITAEDGIKGAKQNLYGRNGKDSIVFLPIGTFVTDLNTNDSFEIINSQNKTLIVRGGKGGRGNNEFKSATNQTPYYAEKGTIGEEKKLLLVLKLIADIGIIGLPNSGKSSLLSVLTRAHPKIGDYPFTTLEPNLGVLKGIVIADIPGIIEGASNGKGLGTKFLKHVEKTRALVHCIDIQSENLKKDYEIIRKELEEYGKNLSEKEEILVLTKSDLTSDKTIKLQLNKAQKLNKISLSISIYDEKSLNNLKSEINRLVN